MNVLAKLRSPAVGRYAAAGVEQALWSALNLGINLVLVRLLAPEGYGAFVFWANCAFALASLQNALTTCHLQVLAPGAGTDPHRLPTEQLMLVVTAAFLALVSVCVFASGPLMHGHALAAPEAALFIPAFLLQQYGRALTFSRGTPAMAASQTGVVLVLSVLFLGADAAFGPPLDAGAVLLCMGAAYGLVGVGTLIVATTGQLRSMLRIDLRAYGHLARQSGWVFLGVTSTEMLGRFYAFVVAAWYGPGPLAALAATQLLLRPIPLLAAVWAVVARPDLAKLREGEAWRHYGRKTRHAVMGGVVAAVAWTACVWLAWPFISSHIFGGKYASFSWMVAIWGVSAMLSFGQLVISSALQVLYAFRQLALANAAASVVAAIAIMGAMKIFGYGAAVVGTAIGQLLEFVIMAILLAGALRRRAAETASAAAR